MGIRKYKPTTPGRCGASVSDFAELTRSIPEKSLLVPKPKTGGRNNSGRTITRHIGDGHKQTCRIVNFKRCDGDGVPAKAVHIEYDPNRTARIVLLHYRDGEKHYTIAPNGLAQGIVVVSGLGLGTKPGNNPELRQIPIGTTVYAAGPRPRGGAKLGCSAGTAIQLVAREGKCITLRMPSGEMRIVDVRCCVTTGAVDNTEQSSINRGKAGRNRWKGIRPTVRGVVMNLVDHLYGGGEGRTSGGCHPVSLWSKPEGRTRGKNKASSRPIVRRRETGKKR